MENEIFVRLRIFSDLLLPDAITQRIGLQPDKTVTKGDHGHGQNEVIAKRTEWILESGCPRSEPLEKQVTDLLLKLEPVSKNIRSLALDCEIVFSCAVYAEESPPLYIARQVIRDIANMDAALDIDLYLASANIE